MSAKATTKPAAKSGKPAASKSSKAAKQEPATYEPKGKMPKGYVFGQPVTFNGYADDVSDPVLEAGETIYLVDYDAEDKSFLVSREQDGLPIENVVSKEILTKGDAAKAEKQAAKKAEKQSAKPAKVEEALPPIKVLGSVKKALEAAKGDVLKAALGQVKASEASYYVLGGILALVEQDRAWVKAKDSQGNNFSDDLVGCKAYMAEALNLDYRKARYLIDIFRTTQAAGLSEADVIKHGWSKVRECVRLLTKDNASELIGLMDDMPYAEFKDEMKKRLTSDGAKVHGNTKAVVAKLTFALHNDQADMVQSALERAKQSMIDSGENDSPTESEALVYILTEWSQLQD
jgi:hypothetical protein